MRGRGCPAAGRPPSPLRGARPRRRPRREGPPAPAVAHRLLSRRRSIPRSMRIRIGPTRSMRSTGIIRRCLCRRRLRIRRRRRTRRLEGEGPQREEQHRQHRQRPSRVRHRPPMPPLRPLLPLALLPPAPPPVRCIIISRIHRSSLRRRRRLGLDRGPEPSSSRPRHPGEASRGRWPT